MSRQIAVTGSASGIGKALAAVLRDNGDEVIGVDRSDAVVTADLSTPEGRRAAVEGVRSACRGVLDGIVACAGTSVPGPLMVTVNYFGATAFVEGLHACLIAAPAPRVAVVGSISGTQASDEVLVSTLLDGDEPAALRRAQDIVGLGRAQQLYPSSKSSLAKWARRTAVTAGWADAGIPVNVVAPGVVLTPMSAGLFDDPLMKGVMDAAVPMPLNGYAQPEVIAAALAFLVSEQNTHITGQVLYVDGGAEATLRGPAVF